MEVVPQPPSNSPLLLVLEDDWYLPVPTVVLDKPIKRVLLAILSTYIKALELKNEAMTPYPQQWKF